MGSEAGDRAVPTLTDVGRQVRFGASLAGHGEPRKVLEEQSDIMRSTPRCSSRVLAWPPGLCTSVPHYTGNPRAGCTPAASSPGPQPLLVTT